VNATIVVYVFYGRKAHPKVYVVPHTPDTTGLLESLRDCHGQCVNDACDRVIETMIEDLFGGGPKPPRMEPYLWDPVNLGPLPVTLVEYIETGEVV
jgi:hypothetical protein